MKFWRRRKPEVDESDRDEVLKQLRFARELATSIRAEQPTGGGIGSALAAWFGETALYIENVLGEETRDFFEAGASAPGRAALIDLYLSRIDHVVERVPVADLRFVGEELRAYGRRWRHDIAERMSTGDHWSRSAAT